VGNKRVRIAGPPDVTIFNEAMTVRAKERRDEHHRPADPRGSTGIRVRGAKSDWIQQTLVTVDVTGTWRSTEGVLVELLLEQQGSKVTGSIRRGSAWDGAIVGTVGGDLFRFKQTSGPPWNVRWR